ncbi:hypothetical protein BH10PSE6_BH10PSE6_20510 [soil metagenome]
MTPATTNPSSEVDVAQLRRRHQELIKASLTKQAPGEECRAFAQQLIEAGRHVPSGRDREALRKMLYYWTAEAVGMGGLRKDEQLPSLMPYEDGGPPVPESVTSGFDRTLAAEDMEARPDTRAAIRIAALARQWQVAGRSAGYLLSGEALEEAKTFRDRDPEIAIFVEASKEAEMARKEAEAAREASEARAKAKRWRILSLVALTVVCVLGVAVWRLWVLTDELRVRTGDLQTRNVELQRAQEQKALLDEALIAESGRENQKTREEARAAIEGLNAGGENPTRRLKELLQRLGDAQPSDRLDRLQIKQDDRPFGITSAQNTVTLPQAQQTAARPSPRDASTCEGVLWLGSEQDRLVTNDGPLASLQPGTIVTLRDDVSVRLRRAMPSPSYTMATQIGVVPGNASVILKDRPEAHKSPNGTVTQYFATVTTPRQYCTRVFVQYWGDEGKLRDLRSKLVEHNFQVPPSQQIKSADNTADVRVFAKEDLPMAKLVADTLRSFNGDKPLAVRELYDFPTKPAVGTIEVWIDLKR